MTLRDLYEQVGGDYSEALGRLQMDKLVERFIVRFLDDDSCTRLARAWAAGDEQGAFEAAHTAKGVCANLGLKALSEPAGAITEALRPGNDALRAGTDVDALVAQVAEAYRKTADAIRAYADGR